MASHRYSFRSAHLVMWSSPLLLLVLVFTLTNSTKTPDATTAHHPSPDQTSTSAPPATTSTVAASTTTTTATTATTTTSEASATPSYSATGSTATPVAPASGSNVSSGGLEGNLDHAFPVAVVPLQGPGTWTLVTSAAVRSLLNCATTSSSVTGRVVIAQSQSCQLEITSSNPEVSQTWQLVPAQ